MKTRIIAISLIASLASAGVAHCCTAFLASYGDIVLASNNEEYMRTATELIWNINIYHLVAADPLARTC